MTVSKTKLTTIFGVALITVIALSGTAYAIKNGQPDEDAHPYVCWIVTWEESSPYVYLGTGALINSTHVLTAGHMTYDPNIDYIWVSFDPIAAWSPFNTTGVWKTVSSWDTHPDYSIYEGEKGLTDWISYDVGILILDVPVPLDEYAELPAPGYVDTLSMKEGVDLVGYGVQWQIHGGGPPYWDWIDFGCRYNASAQLVKSKHIMSDGFMRLTANPGKEKGGTCYGDSGGPILKAGTNIVLGVCSWGTNGNCAGVSYEQRIDLADILDWITGDST